MEKIKIVKLDQEPTKLKVEKPKGKLAKTMKTFPRGVLRSKTTKIIAVSDPAKSPPVKRSMRKHTIRLFTPLGEKRRQKTVKKRVSKMTDKQVTALVSKHNLLMNSTTPSRVKREMLAGAMLAGFISDA